MKFIILLLLVFINLFAQNKDFDLYKKEGTSTGHTLLVIGGIHGDEPGGYFAPTFLEKYYKIINFINILIIILKMPKMVSNI